MKATRYCRNCIRACWQRPLSSTSCALASAFKMVGTPLVQYISPEELGCVLKDPAQLPGPGKLVVVDVRDDDYVGGHIKGALNIHSQEFLDQSRIDKVIDEHLSQGIDKVVVHCMFSQQRGPRSAMRLATRLRERNMSDLEVFVLKGGFAHFVRRFRRDGDLVEDVMDAYWGS